MAADTIALLLISDSQEERTTAMDMLANVDYIQVVGEGKSGDDARELVKERVADILLIGSGVDGDGYNLAGELLEINPELAVVIIDKALTEETIRRAIAAGARDVILYPFDPSRLVQALYMSVQGRGTGQDGNTSKKPEENTARPRGRILTFFSTKGGVGKTFTAVNTAVALATESDLKVCLVDLDLDFGNAALAFNISTKRSLLELIEEIDILDEDLLEGYLVAHRTGVKVLPAGTMNRSGEEITGEHVNKILRTLLYIFDFVVVDMPARLISPLDPALREADRLFLITTPEISTIRNVKLVITMLEANGYPLSKIRILLNRADIKSGISAGDVTATLKEDIYAVIPADYRRAAISLNRGIPLVLLYPRSKPARAIKGLALQIADSYKKGSKL